MSAAATIAAPVVAPAGGAGPGVSLVCQRDKYTIGGRKRQKPTLVSGLRWWFCPSSVDRLRSGKRPRGRGLEPQKPGLRRVSGPRGARRRRTGGPAGDLRDRGRGCARPANGGALATGPAYCFASLTPGALVVYAALRRAVDGLPLAGCLPGEKNLQEPAGDTAEWRPK